MARYTNTSIVAVPLEKLQPLLIQVLVSCNFEIIYNTGDYLMARENPGQVSFAQLVTVEVLIDKSTATDQEIKMNFVIKNEELPLQIENHCHQVFKSVQQAIAQQKEWKLLQSINQT